MLVWPKNDQTRKMLKHPKNIVFRETGPADWPEDSFTHRRLMDGDILKEAPPGAAPDNKATPVASPKPNK